MRSDNIATILDACLERIRRGESIQSCVLDYPSEAEELEPLLIAATFARRSYTSPALAPEARQRIRRQIQQAVAARQPAPRRPVIWTRPLMRFALALVVALLSLGGGVAAAHSSLPGSSLYPLKRAGEDARLMLASSSTQRAALHLEFAAARSAEILQLANGGQQALDSSLVDELEQEYQLAWQEIEHVPAAKVHDLASQYVTQRQADVTIFSTALATANTATGDQIQRALQLGKQALVVVGPAETPAPQPKPNNGSANDGGPNNHQGQANNGAAPGNDHTHSNGAAASSGKPTEAAPTAAPTEVAPTDTPKAKPTELAPTAKPTELAPTATPKVKPADTKPTAAPKVKPTVANMPTPEGKPDDAGSPATPEGKPADAGPPATPEATQDESKPDNGGGKPADAGSPATPEATQDESKPDNGGGKPDESKPDNGGGKPDNGNSQPKPQPKPKPGKP